jgi:4-hydroxybenzoate polyprenyltransferase
LILSGLFLANDVRDEVVDQLCVTLAQRLHPDGDLDVRKALGIGVLAWATSKLLGDDVLRERSHT